MSHEKITSARAGPIGTCEALVRIPGGSRHKPGHRSPSVGVRAGTPARGAFRWMATTKRDQVRQALEGIAGERNTILDLQRRQARARDRGQPDRVPCHGRPGAAAGRCAREHVRGTGWGPLRARAAGCRALVGGLRRLLPAVWLHAFVSQMKLGAGKRSRHQRHRSGSARAPGHGGERGCGAEGPGAATLGQAPQGGPAHGAAPDPLLLAVCQTLNFARAAAAAMSRSPR